MIYLKDSKIQVDGSVGVAKVFQDILALEDQIEQEKEHYYVMHLNIKNQVLMVELVTVGTVSSSLVHPRETFAGPCSPVLPRSLLPIIIRL